MNTGFLGASAKILGVGAGVVQTLGGGAKTEISVYVIFDTEKKQFGVGVLHTQTDYQNSTDITIGIINGNGSKEKSEVLDANTIDGASSKKDVSFEEKEGGGLVVKNVNVDANDGVVEISTAVSVNAAIVGVEVKGTLSIEPEPKKQEKNK